MIDKATDVELLALEEARRELEAGGARDPSAVARNASVTKGVNVDKARLLRDRPTEIKQVLHADALLDKLAALVPQAIDVAEADVGDEQPALPTGTEP